MTNAQNNAKEPLRGSRLAQMWLDDVPNKLHPAEAKLLEACRRGEGCIIGAERPARQTVQNRVRAGFLRFLILGGCGDAPVHARGVQLFGAWIECDRGAWGVDELDLESASIPHDFALLSCKIDGRINLCGATGWTLNFGGSKVSEIFADRLETRGNVFLRDGFEASGTVRLLGAKLGGVLDCNSGHFMSGDVSLYSDGLETKGSVFLCNGFRASKVVNFRGATIGGQLSCRDGYFGGELLFNEAKITGNVFLDGEFVACGRVSFPNAKIGGSVACNGARLHEKDNSFFANRAVIGGDVEFNNTACAGSIMLTGCVIRGNLSFVGVSLEGVPCAQLRGTQIEGMLRWHHIKFAHGELDLAGASCKTINVGRTSWFRKQTPYGVPGLAHGDNSSGNGKKPKRKRYEMPRVTRIDNFSYSGFTNLPEGTNAAFWFNWLEQQPDDHLGKKFRPKPWSHLADILESMGHEAEAKAIRIRREQLLTRFMARHDEEISASNLRLLWRRIWGVTIDYGYQPHKALFYLGAVIALSWGIFWWAAIDGIMAPTHPLIFKEARIQANGRPGMIDAKCAQNWVYFKGKKCSAQMPPEYSEFSPLVYAMDISLPIIDLRQQDDWSPRVVSPKGARIWSGYVVRAWEWTAIFSGWVLSLMFVSAVGGIIRK